MFFCRAMRASSSCFDQGPCLIRLSRWLWYRSLHCFPVRPVSWNSSAMTLAIRAHLIYPLSSTSIFKTLSSWVKLDVLLPAKSFFRSFSLNLYTNAPKHPLLLIQASGNHWIFTLSSKIKSKIGIPVDRTSLNFQPQTLPECKNSKIINHFCWWTAAKRCFCYRSWSRTRHPPPLPFHRHFQSI